MTKVSAGLLMYRVREGTLQILLAHPGGPFWQDKDEGAWTIPKGQIPADEDAQTAALREFEEETGIRADGPFIDLTPIRQRGGKTVHAWAFEGDCDPAAIESNTFQVEWPPHSGKMREFPEIDRAQFFGVADAKKKINPAQISLIEELQRRLGVP
ncbi:MAG: NUDIX domain-containing protein [Gemmatimonadales bacterium]|nr:NUDIX domain-containing protein [Gemmatimonadales bacterium]NIN11166.1 NUDIX domain-containing protein [Gemmatimonadales bacterium]NIN49765.1 NUDIX domain-containing protein [Gemmatimonadales bacterium]NIP07229.1 NUDIX domain-containing protein [Gemmatimonadales bacterium]NIR00442.1 NUDIX domain-containing protein [Gemmatimonadales bacterium]